MKLKLTEHVGINMYLMHKQSSRWIFNIKDFYSVILNFPLFVMEDCNFQVRNVLADCMYLF